jgi:transposase InsO family protein
MCTGRHRQPASKGLFGEEEKAVGTTGVWRLGTLMGVDPLDGRYRMRYDTEGVEKTLVLSALDFHNHMQARDSRHKGVHVTKIGDLIFLNLGQYKSLNSKTLNPKRNPEP